MFYPNGGERDVLAFGVPGLGDGRPLLALRGHVDSVYCCTLRVDTFELVSGGADGLLLVWDCSRQASGAAAARRKRPRDDDAPDDEDDWSDDGCAAPAPRPPARRDDFASVYFAAARGGS